MRISAILLLGLIVAACVEPYKPELAEENPNYLVVDGFLDAGKGEVTVTLKRTASLNSPGTGNAELNANVLVESSSGTTFVLEPQSGGRYIKSGQPFSFDDSYRLTIETVTNRKYQSEFVHLIRNPPIDSVAWSITDGEVNIDLTTTGSPAESRFYKISYVETFQYHAPYSSPYRITNGKVVPRGSTELVFWCWKTDTLKNVTLVNTSRLSMNKIENYNLLSIPGSSIALSYKYSLLVKQQSLSADAYDYLLNLQKVNENLGTLFDPQPGRVNGNLHCVSHPDEPVVGYFDAGQMQEKRIFISVLDLPENFSSFRYPNCFIDTIYVEDIPASRDLNLVEEFYRFGTGIPYVYCFTYSTDECTDCRKFAKGQNHKPSYWKD